MLRVLEEDWQFGHGPKLGEFPLNSLGSNTVLKLLTLHGTHLTTTVSQQEEKVIRFLIIAKNHTTTTDCHVKIWKIPSDNGLASTILDPIYDLAEHKRKIATVNWHPTAENVLVSSSIDSLYFLSLKIHNNNITILL